MSVAYTDELRGFAPIGMLEYSISGANSEPQKTSISSVGYRNSETFIYLPGFRGGGD
jgi:hypothetical protein